MSRVAVQFEFESPEKINSRNLDRILDVVREWAADRFGADRLEASIRRPGDDVTLAARMESPDLRTHVNALDEFRDALEIWRKWQIEGLPDYSEQPKEKMGLRLVLPSSGGGEK